MASDLIPKEMIDEARSDRFVGNRLGVHPDFPSYALINDKGETVGFQLPSRSKKNDKLTTGTLYIGKKHRGNGYATQALQSYLEEHPDSISYVNEKNVASQRAHAKAGWYDTGKRVQGNRRATVWEKKAVRLQGIGLLNASGRSKVSEAVVKTPAMQAYTLYKESSSRWREAIYSGELPPAETARLKSFMNVNPLRESEGLVKGWTGTANYFGVPSITTDASGKKLMKAPGSNVRIRNPRKEFEKIKTEGLGPSAGHVTRHLTRQDPVIENLPDIVSGKVAPGEYNSISEARQLDRRLRNARVMPHTFVPHAEAPINQHLFGIKEMNDVSKIRKLIRGDSSAREKGREYALKLESMGLPVNRKLKDVKDALQAHRGMVAAHEAMELRENVRQRRLGRPDGPFTSHGHVSPKVILDEIRKRRMLADGTKFSLLDAARVRNEFPEVLKHAPQKVVDQPYLPRKQLRRLSNFIEREPSLPEIMHRNSPHYHDYLGSLPDRKKWLRKLLAMTKRMR